MKIDQTICFIGGGRMAEALVIGITESGLAGSGQITAVDPDEGRRNLLAEKYMIKTTDRAGSVIKKDTIVILAVKPQIMGVVLDSISERIDKNHLVVSIAAGISIDYIARRLSGNRGRIIRVMPNTPALIMEGVAAISPGEGVSSDDMDIARKIFESVGKAVILKEEYLDAVTGLSGSGPAYVFSFIEGLIDAGVKVGLSRADAELLTLQTVLGSVKLAMATGDHPAQLRAMVTSPGGTTIAGLHELEKAGFRGIIMNAVEAATNRSKELG